MDRGHKFQSYRGRGLLKTDSFFHRRKTVIKSKAVRLCDPRKVEIAADKTDEGRESKVDPILQDGRIIGFVNRCSCGSVTEILLEFEEEAASTVRELPENAAEEMPETDNGQG